MSEIKHNIGDRVLILSNIKLGDLIGTVTGVYNFSKSPTYDVELDEGGLDRLFGFQLQPLPDVDAVG